MEGENEKFEDLEIWQDSVELTVAVYTFFIDSKDGGFLCHNPIDLVWPLKKKIYEMTKLNDQTHIIGQTLRTYSYSHHPNLFDHSNSFIHNYYSYRSYHSNESNPPSLLNPLNSSNHSHLTSLSTFPTFSTLPTFQTLLTP